jgi:hypothetical protein
MTGHAPPSRHRSPQSAWRARTLGRASTRRQVTTPIDRGIFACAGVYPRGRNGGRVPCTEEA